ncbi:hypothetical protein AUP68_06023 [Ilyonectria robusta]
MPRSAPNIDRGNFMISLHLLDATADGRLDTSAQLHAAEHAGFGETEVLFSSRRSALLPYVDPFVSLATRVLFLFYHIFAPGSSTSEMVIPLAERVWFPKGSKIPGSAYVEVEAGQAIQVYHAGLRLTAQLRGLRWLMVHYRISTYLAFTFLFWVCELVFMGIAWGIWSATTGSPPGDGDVKTRGLEGAWRQAVKDEEEKEGGQREEEDRPTTFPTDLMGPRGYMVHGTWATARIPAWPAASSRPLATAAVVVYLWAAANLALLPATVHCSASPLSTHCPPTVHRWRDDHRGHPSTPAQVSTSTPLPTHGVPRHNR